MSTRPFLMELKNVTIGYKKGRPLLDKFSLEIDRGNFLSIVGSNGSGKTTLVKTILNLLPPLSGTISRKAKLRFGYVPQKSNTNLSFPLTVTQVVMHGRVKRIGLLNKPSTLDHAAVAKAMNDLGLEGLAERNIHTLSGGQYQRMLIARALASEPDILVLDEPTRGMDIVAEHTFVEMVGSLKDKLNLTIVMVTHDLTQAARISDQLVVINSMEKTLRVGPPSEILTNSSLSKLFHQPVHIHRIGEEISIVVGPPKHD